MRFPVSVRCALLILAAALVSAPAIAQWETVAPGLEYRHFTLPGPVEAYVTRMECGSTTAQQSLCMQAPIAQGQLYKTGLVNGGRETVTGMVVRYDDSIGYHYQNWGMRHGVQVAVNGDYWEREYSGGPYTGRPQGGQVEGGWFARRFGEITGGSGFFTTVWGIPHLGGDVKNGSSGATQVVKYADNAESSLTGVNVARGTSDLILYTPQWGPATATDATGVEVVVRMSRPNLVLFDTSYASGTILEVRDQQVAARIPFDCVVVSGTGSYATTLRNKCVAGQSLRLQMKVVDIGLLGRTPPLPAQDWTKAYACVGVDREVVVAGMVSDNMPVPDATRDPRTGVGFNATHIFLVVVDGRSAASIGMNFAELGAFFVNQLGATEAASLDGGGSSEMWVRGKGIVNVPSDGGERATCNGLMMCTVSPMAAGNRFAPGNAATLAAGAPLRTGPGANYPLVSSLASGQTGTILTHSMNGIRASGDNWWYWQAGSQSGWSPDSAFVGASAVGEWGLY